MDSFDELAKFFLCQYIQIMRKLFLSMKMFAGGSILKLTSESRVDERRDLKFKLKGNSPQLLSKIFHADFFPALSILSAFTWSKSRRESKNISLAFAVYSVIFFACSLILFLLSLLFSLPVNVPLII